MKVMRVDMYLDGGTAVIATDVGKLYVDSRIHTPTPFTVWDGYPGELKSARRDELVEPLIAALKDFDAKDGLYKDAVPLLVKNMTEARNSR